MVWPATCFRGGIFGEPTRDYDATKIIPALETKLIEALEPRQNRTRGYDLSAVDYIQREDSEIQEKWVKECLELAMNRL